MKKTKRILVLVLIVSFLITINFSLSWNPIKADQDSGDKYSSEKEKFLYGYDVASGKNLLEPGALKTNAAIIDKNSDYIEKHVIYHDGFKQRSDNVVEYSLKKVAEEYSKKISAGIYGRIFAVDTGISGEFDLATRIENCKSEKYEMYTTWITNHYFDVDLKPSQIKNYLSEDFKKELYNVKSVDDANRLYNTYGTHLNTGYMFGGRLNVTQYMSTDDATHSLSKATSLNQKMNIAISRINAGESASISEEFTSLENDKSIKSSYKFTSYGGRAISSLTVDDLFTFNQSYFDVSKSGFMYTIWINSINDNENLAIVGIPDNAYSLKIWELLDYSDERSTQIREYLIDAYLDRCGEAYNKYMQGLDVIEHEIDFSEIEESAISSFEGLYVSTPNSRFFYYVDKKDLDKTGSHYGIQNKEKLYLCFDEALDSKEISFVTRNCDIIDEKKGIFIVNSSGENVVIKMIYEGKEKELINIPVISSNFEGGMGTEKYPYIINDKAQFKKIATNLKAYYILCSDINFGRDSIPCLGDFEGQLDGNYCTISNFTIESSSKWGLFRYNNGVIKNLSIKNAGSSLNYQDFSMGGMNYEEDYKNDNYTINSICTEVAGILCAENTNNGKIEGCYLENVFIRNIIKNNDSYIYNSSASIPVGALTGINSGEINGCMVKDACILNAFVYYNKKKNFNCSVLSGGLIGEIKGGSIKSCVVDMGTLGLNISQTFMWYDLPLGHVTADVVIHSYSGGFAGYCNANASVDNCFVYVRNGINSSEYHSIDALYKNYNTMGYSEAKEYRAIRCGSIICGENSSIASNKNWITCKDSMIPIELIRPTKNGDNRKEKGNDTFERIPGVFYNGGIGSETQFDSLGISDKYYNYDSKMISGVSHILSLERERYIKLSQDSSDMNSEIDIYAGQRYSPNKVDLHARVNGHEENVTVFKYLIVGEYEQNATNFPLVNVGESMYFLTFSLYDTSISTERIPINVHESSLLGIIVDDGINEKIEIYGDDVTDFKNSPLNYLKIKGVLSDGTKEDIETLDENYKKYISFEGTEKITNGDNTLKIKYNKGKYNFEIQTIVKVIERTPTNLIILNKDEILNILNTNKDKYKENTKLSESDLLNNIHIKVDFDKGNSVELVGKDALSKLEIEGDVLSRGNNHVVLSYGNFDAKDSFDIEDVEESIAEDIVEDVDNENSTLWIWVLTIIIIIIICLVIFRKRIFAIVSRVKKNGNKSFIDEQLPDRNSFNKGTINKENPNTLQDEDANK